MNPTPPPSPTPRRKIEINLPKTPPVDAQPVVPAAKDHAHKPKKAVPVWLWGVLGGLIVLIGAWFWWPRTAPADPAQRQASLSPRQLDERLRNMPHRDEVNHGKKSFQVFLRELKLSHADVMSLDNLGKTAGLEWLREGTQYSCYPADESEPIRFLKLHLDPFYDYLVRMDRPDSFMVARLDKVEKRVPKVITGLIDSTLFAAITAKVRLADRVLYLMEEALAYKVDFYHLDPGDKFKIYYEEVYADSTLVGVGRLYGVEIRTQDKNYRIYTFPVQQGKLDFFDAEGKKARAGFLKSPVTYGRVTSRFGMRFHPVDQEFRLHKGTDFAASEGSPVVAVAAGEILEASQTEHNGNYVKIQHADGFTTQYLHLQNFEEGIKRGVQVQQGQRIGYVGKTGKATGPHVCLHLRQNGEPADLLSLDIPVSEAMPAGYLPAFIAHRDSVNQVMDGVLSGR
ncbi:MAG: M23 family metallopeptidase [Bacteroidia bacterium]|nr:M23 family metallopeptidase [Bacteroidia bacterium]